MPARHLWVAAAGSLAASLLWLAPLVAHPGSALLQAPSDASSTIRQYASAEHQGKSVFTISHDPLLAAPEGTTYSWAAQVANAIQPAFVLALETVVGYVAALNVFTLLAFALTGFLAYILLARVGLHPLAAAFGAYVVAFNPYAFEKAELGQPALVHNWVLIVLLLALLRLEQRRTLADAALAGLAAALCFYMHTYLGFVGLVAVLVFLGVDVIRRREWRRWARTTAVGAATLVLALLPAAVATMADRTAAGQLTSDRAEVLQDFGAPPSAYLAPPSGGLLAAATSPRSRTERVEAATGVTLYFGYVTLALALLGAVLLLRRHPVFDDPRRRALALGAGALTVVGFLVALPDRMTVLGVEFPGPSALLGQVTTGVRVYARFGILVIIGAAILAAFALDLLVRRRRGAALGAAAVALVAIELAVGPPIETWRTDEPPAYDAWLATQPAGIAAMYPAPGDKIEAEEHTRRETYFQTTHWHPLLFTESPRKTRGWAIRELVDHLDEPGVPELLAAQKVRYVIVNDAVYRTMGERPPHVPGTLRLLRRFDGARAFEVVAEKGDVEDVLRRNAARVAAAMGIAAPTVTIPGDGFHDAERSALDGRDWRWLIQSGALEVEVPEASVQFVLKGIAVSPFRNRTLSLEDEDGTVLGTADVGTATADIAIGPFRLPAGRSRLRLAVSPPPEQLGASDTRHASIFLSPVEIQPLADYSRR
jgi:hypothetical protein